MTENKIQTLYNKYRPRTFDDLIGQEHVSLVMAKGLRNGRASHAYLMCGSRGSGKTTTARILATAFNCEKGMTAEPCGECIACRDIIENRCIDIVEIDCASKNGVDHIRSLQESVMTVPSQVRTKFYIMDEVHQLTSAAQNSFLKTLEEPPPNVVFILCTTEPDKLKDTIVSRTQVHQFHRIPASKLAQRLLYIAEKENIKLDENAALAIARSSEGGARDAISKFDAAINVAEGNHVTLDIAAKVLGTIGIEIIGELAGAVINGKVSDILKHVGLIVDSTAMLQPVYLELLRYFRNLMVTSISNDHASNLDLGDQTAKQMLLQAKQKPTSWYLSAVQTILNYNRLMDSVKGRVALETMCLEIALQKKETVVISAPSPQRWEWSEIKSWFPTNIAILLNKTPVYATPDGLFINPIGLSENDQKILEHLNSQVKEALVKNKVAGQVTVAKADVISAMDMFKV
jgi:DNA polymerase III subunit gamma/tau